MPVFHLNNLPKSKRIQMIGEFYDTIDSLKDRQEVRLFFKSLLTADEIAALMRRIEVAVLLFSKYNYDQIKEMLGVGNNMLCPKSYMRGYVLNYILTFCAKPYVGFLREIRVLGFVGCQNTGFGVWMPTLMPDMTRLNNE